MWATSLIVAFALIGAGLAVLALKRPGRVLSLLLIVSFVAGTALLVDSRAAEAATTSNACVEQVQSSVAADPEMSEEELSLILWDLFAALLEFIVAEYEIFATTDGGLTWTQVATVEPDQQSFQTSELELPEETEFLVRAVSDTGESEFVATEGAAAYIPEPSKADQLVAAARAQLGEQQDSTALVERSLRAIGYNVGDIGPMAFGQFGFRVNPADVQAGDIMMRGGHVAIYSGNGMAIQGGFGGSTVETGYDANPNGYSVIIRLL